jgi:DNA repair/transcription protein MET18/MMS19
MCSRLEDHYTVSTSALPGLKSLLTKHLSPAFESNEDNELNKVSREKTLDIIKSILRDIHVQSMVQSDRLTVFSLCHFVLTSQPHAEMIKNEKYDTDFVYGFIQAMDGEKDPRNLVVCFECIQLLCQKFRLGPFVEETFEIFSCYFPIDFTPVTFSLLILIYIFHYFI